MSPFNMTCRDGFDTCAVMSNGPTQPIPNQSVFDSTSADASPKTVDSIDVTPQTHILPECGIGGACDPYAAQHMNHGPNRSFLAMEDVM